MVKKSKVKQNKASAQQKYFTNCKSYYSCIHCRAHIANHDEIISRSFQGNLSRAYLFNNLVNVSQGPSVHRELNTGPHSVADLFCAICKTKIGWKYDKAFVESQKYKEGKYIIEIGHVIRENKHLELDRSERILRREMRRFSIDSTSNVSSATSTATKPKQPSNFNPFFSSASQNCDSRTINNSEQASNSIDNQSFIDNQQRQHDSSIVPMQIGEQQDQHSQLSKHHHHQNAYCNDKDYDLNSPVYDDLYTKLLVYPSTLSQSYSRRTKRQLFSNSKPYDWKSTPVRLDKPKSARRSEEYQDDDSAAFKNRLLCNKATTSSKLAIYSNSAGTSTPMSSSSTSSCSTSPTTSGSSASTSSTLSQQHYGNAKKSTIRKLMDNYITREDIFETSEDTQFNLEEAESSSQPPAKQHRRQPSTNVDSSRNNSSSLSLKSLSLESTEDDEEFFDCSSS